MKYLSKWILLLFYSVIELTSKNLALICYSCTSTLSPLIDENAQMALRVFLNAFYKIPPTSSLCGNENSLEFKIVPTMQCSVKDQCVKITSKNADLKFVIRGCKSMIIQEGIQIAQDLECSYSSSPSLCTCETNLCNSTFKSIISNVLLILSLLLVYSLKFITL